MTESRDALFDRLRRLSVLKPAPAPESAAPARGGAMPGRVEAHAEGPVRIADWSYPRRHAHGGATLDAHASWRARTAAAAARDARFLDVDPDSWLFLDTETTSLNSGAGVWVFMVGVGWFEGSSFRVRQFMLTDPAGERALLRAVHDRVRAAGALVSFHGKSFDAPRLDDRFRLAGLEPALAGRPHFDLLHPVRRLHAHRLPDCRLRTIEEDVLGFRRVGDLPGALCPEAYFAYLRGRPHRLADVFEHNKLDVLSLGALAGALAAAYEGGCPDASAVRIALDWASAGELERARTILVAAARAGEDAPVGPSLAAARLLRNLGETEAAERLLTTLSVRAPADPRPGLALKRLQRRSAEVVASSLQIQRPDCKL